jgi:hypothetical protein
LARFGFPFDRRRIPMDGIYVLFEEGEIGHCGSRIVRLGTHTGRGQLPSRLEQHFLKENKDRSIFRKNVGRCLLSRDGDPFLAWWDLDLTTSKARAKYGNLMDRDKLKAVEGRVSEYIRRAFTFAVFSVGEKQDRLRFESRMISTVSCCEECGPSGSWLGLFSPKEKIRKSGLWQVNELYKKPLSTDDVEELELCLPL